MVMGPTHAMSGAAAGLLAGPGLAAAAGHPMTVQSSLLAAAVCAGSALLPDIDCPTSTVARSFGVVSKVVSHAVDNVAVVVYAVTRGRHDEVRHSGHRTLTHTLLGAIGTGVGVSALCARVGKWAVLATLVITLCLAVRGLLADWAKKEGWIVTTGTAVAGTALAWWTLPAGSYWWLGGAVTLGMVLHDLGDAITKAGVPLLAPLPLGGKRWLEFTTGPFAIRAGGRVECALVLPACTLITVLGIVSVLNPGLIDSVLGR